MLVCARELDLRPVYYSERADVRKALHPDQRACPSWCWVGQHPEYGHEIDHTHPLVAEHHMEAIPAVVANLYRGDRHVDGYVHAATIEPRLEQLGQDDPIVRVAFRPYEGRELRYDYELLRLTVMDARELVVAWPT